MNILLNRLLILINDESPDSTYHHIAFTILQNMEKLNRLSIDRLAGLCSVSKSTVSKFIRAIGYEDYGEFREAADCRNYNYGNSLNYYNSQVTGYMEHHSARAFASALQQDISMTMESLDWQMVEQLAEDLAAYDKTAAFGLMFSETAALDLQIKLFHCGKYIMTNLSDLKQDQYIRQAGPDTLIIIFSDSGTFLQPYRKKPYSAACLQAKIVMITSNPAAEDDPLVSYCICYRQTPGVSTHHILYGLLTDIIVFRYRELTVRRHNGRD